MASVRKRTYKDGTAKWVVDFRDDRGNRVLKTFDHKKSADAFRNNIVVEVQAGRFLPKWQSMTWNDAVTAWLDHCRKRASKGDRMTLGTVASYEGASERLKPFFGKLNLSDITTAKVQEAADEIFKRLSVQSVRHSVRAAFCVCRHAQDLGRLKVNPVDERKLSLPALKRKPEIPPKDALRAILAAVNSPRGPHDQRAATAARRAIIMLALFGGLRRGEICGLQWGDIDFVRSVISIRRSSSYHDGIKGPKTKAGYRSVPMVAPIVDALQAVRELRSACHLSAESFVFLTYRNKRLNPTSVYGDHWRPVLIKAGLITKDEKTPYHFHSLRHAAVSLLIDQGLSPMHIKGMIGHSSVSTTIDVYGHLFPNDDAVSRASTRVVGELLATQTQLAQLSG